MAAHSTRGAPTEAYGADLGGALEIQAGDGIQRQAPAGQEILDTTQDQRTAQARLAFRELRMIQPPCADNPAIQRLRRTVIAD